jgi:DNA-binding NarL/FixJ family response regulator
MTGLCTDCPKRPLCSSLCPEAELYVKQDEVEQRELNLGLIRHGKWPENRDKSLFTRMEKKILSLLSDGQTREQIAQELEITREALKKHIKRLRLKGTKIHP